MRVSPVEKNEICLETADASPGRSMNCITFYSLSLNIVKEILAEGFPLGAYFAAQNTPASLIDDDLEPDESLLQKGRKYGSIAPQFLGVLPQTLAIFTERS